MVKLLRKIDQWLLIGRDIEISPTDIDANGARLIARGRTLGGPDDGTPFDRPIELHTGQSTHFGPHVVLTLLEVRADAVKLGVLAPANVPVLTREQSNQLDQRRENDGK
jgi:sRNA-binding carbon storage regulator CsrA